MNDATLIAIIISVLSIIVSLIAIFNFLSQRRRAAMEEGKKDNEIEQMRKDLDRAHEKIRTLENCNAVNDKDIALMKRDIEYIKVSVDEIKEILNKRGAQ
jgi:5-bromo-4-chloroindolyl phosphate hydrolysis protein